MLQLQTIRQNPQEVKEKLAIKSFKELSLVDEILQLDEQRKKCNWSQTICSQKLMQLQKKLVL
jgi:seryl-tRNA synthetase